MLHLQAGGGPPKFRLPSLRGSISGHSRRPVPPLRAEGLKSWLQNMVEQPVDLTVKQRPVGYVRNIPPQLPSLAHVPSELPTCTCPLRELLGEKKKIILVCSVSSPLVGDLA